MRVSEGHQSEQIDVVIHDQHFSPLLFEVGNARFIPAESVYAAFEVKQHLDKGNVDYAADKIATVRALHRTTAPVPHAGGMYDPITPRRIIGGVLTRRSDWSPPFGEPFRALPLPKTSSVQLMPHVGTREAPRRAGRVVVYQVWRFGQEP